MYFEQSTTMGNAAAYGPGYHDVTVRVSGQFVRDVPSWIVYASGASLLGVGAILADAGKNAAGIKALLESKLWIVESVVDQSGWFGEYIFNISVVVANGYNDAAVQQSIQQALSELFIVNGVSIVSSGYSSAGPTIQNPPNTPPANYVPPTGGAAVPGGSGLPSIIPNSSLDAFASSLGVSTPIAIAGGLVLLVLILKR